MLENTGKPRSEIINTIFKKNQDYMTEIHADNDQTMQDDCRASKT